MVASSYLDMVYNICSCSFFLVLDSELKYIFAVRNPESLIWINLTELIGGE